MTRSTAKSKKSKRKPRHVPKRTCVGCRRVDEKRALIRVVRRPDGVFVDPTGKMPGRGAYLHDDPACWERGLQGALARALKTKLTTEDQQRLQTFAATLKAHPAEEPDA